ncbi:hypothetical protein CR513_06852, partial [Mucuna pruriens]
MNIILSQLLRFEVMGGMTTHVEFAYNRIINNTTSHYPFELIMNMSSRLNEDGFSKAQFVKKLHEKAQSCIEKKVEQYARKAYLRKEMFPTLRKSRLLPRGDEPFKILKRINNNAYKYPNPKFEVKFSLRKGLVEDTQEGIKIKERTTLQDPTTRDRMRRLQGKNHKELGL